MELQQGIESFIGNILNDDLRFESFTHSTSKGSTSTEEMYRFFNHSKLESCEDEFLQLDGFSDYSFFQNHGRVKSLYLKGNYY